MRKHGLSTLAITLLLISCESPTPPPELAHAVVFVEGASVTPLAGTDSVFIKVPYTIMAPTRENLMFTPCGTTISRLNGVSADSVWAYACDQGETWINDPAKIAATHVIEFSLVILGIPGVGEMEHWTSPVEGTYLLQLPGLSRARSQIAEIERSEVFVVAPKQVAEW
ncbi:MAG: hypothetical protein ACYC28_01710 [Longimicrobiales bacterium]